VLLPTLSETAPGPSVVEPAVKALQAVLIGKWGINPGQIDGRFGPLTAGAVRQLQSEAAGKSGPVDGIAGPLTWAYLVDG
jgi:peptidoglycan hydrolase-like protein with peptidoglycan-binding domain